ncbi:hypothetical protein GOP47_0007380 [Adiantum capillus-veneris]|uniref:Uncharacterized protein n=1 Tax=Adiantum capillus-veneris TaxID=13818 RepID=A0A9D4V167_ADICA|nr:hypothetical protein GOP47_0007380 [Adiantum capillus-veneris]
MCTTRLCGSSLLAYRVSPLQEVRLSDGYATGVGSPVAALDPDSAMVITTEVVGWTDIGATLMERGPWSSCCPDSTLEIDLLAGVAGLNGEDNVSVEVKLPDVGDAVLSLNPSMVAFKSECSRSSTKQIIVALIQEDCIA